MSPIRKADGCLASPMNSGPDGLSSYFIQLYTVFPPNGRLRDDGLQEVDVISPTDEAPPLVDEIK